MLYSPDIQVMVRAVQKAAKGLVRDFGEVENLQVSKKGPKDFVSTADFRAEKILMEELKTARPSYSFLTEESGIVGPENSGARWVIDPLDGTTNFLHGFPDFCISVALEKQQDGKKEITAGIIYSPVHKELFWAEKGKGAWIESGEGRGVTRLRVAGRSHLEDCLVIVGALRGNDKAFADKIYHMAALTSGIRCIGSTALALAYIAAGRGDIFFQKDMKFWDVAAGLLLIREAGGVFTDFSGKKYTEGKKELLAANDTLALLAEKRLASVLGHL